MIDVEDSFIQQTFIKYLLYAKYYSRHWGFSSKHNRKNSCPCGADIPEGISLEIKVSPGNLLRTRSPPSSVLFHLSNHPILQQEKRSRLGEMVCSGHSHGGRKWQSWDSNPTGS